ncbi:hypothetical protein LCGC14_0499330 [marine sediment metagenome]|uniref:Uncharacterized protein n=1 Tax=marine sediment metagenome TaxID=412755 RepID=A0A0F9VD15_9ZZZZ
MELKAQLSTAEAERDAAREEAGMSDAAFVTLLAASTKQDDELTRLRVLVEERKAGTPHHHDRDYPGCKVAVDALYRKRDELQATVAAHVKAAAELA